MSKTNSKSAKQAKPVVVKGKNKSAPALGPCMPFFR
jgi:hypothetical protein